VIREGNQADELMQCPKGCQDERIIDCSRAGPDFLQPERADYAWIPGQMRFIVPNESSIENSGVRGNNKYNQENCPNPISPPEKSNHQ